MPVLNTIRQEVFARNVAEGKSYRDSAIAAGYSVRSASCLGSQLMQQARIVERVNELKVAPPRNPITRESVVQHLPPRGQATERAIAIRDEGGALVGFYVVLTICEPASAGKSHVHYPVQAPVATLLTA